MVTKKIISKRRWRILRFFILGWTLAFIFLSIVRGVGTQELGALKFSFQESLLISITLGPIMGLVSGTAQILLEERFYQYLSLKKLLVIQLVYILLFLTLLIISAYSIYNLFFGTDVSLLRFAFDEGSGAIYFFMIITDFSLSVLRQISLMLGEGNLSKMLLGKFYSPREENRIFMFLDLQSSTTLAERLGHIEYSKLIQDCFNDLGIVVGDKAEIYQYVGDEAVLTWPTKDGIQNQNCLKAFHNFKNQLEKKRKHYHKKYGYQPFFKAGLHSGTVTVTEVGKYKKEIAYHGDVMNTSARIQGKCNDFKEELLISEELKNQLKCDDYEYTALGSIPLKGKKETVPIYAVSLKPLA